GRVDGQRARSLRRHTFPFVRDDRRVLRGALGRADIVERTNREVAHRARRRVRARVEKRERASERETGQADHPAELTSSKDTDAHGSTLACSARRSASILSSGRCSARCRVLMSAVYSLATPSKRCCTRSSCAAYFSHCTPNSPSNDKISLAVRSSRKLS